MNKSRDEQRHIPARGDERRADIDVEMAQLPDRGPYGNWDPTGDWDPLFDEFGGPWYPADMGRPTKYEVRTRLHTYGLTEAQLLMAEALADNWEQGWEALAEAVRLLDQ